MSRTPLLNLPHTEAWTTGHFLQESLTQSEAGGNILASCSKKVEDSVKEMLDVLRSTAFLQTINSFDPEDVVKSKLDDTEMFETQCEDLFTHFKHRNLESLIASVRSSLDSLRRCITTSTARSLSRTYSPDTGSQEDSPGPVACFQADLILSLPNIVMQPSLEDMQNTVNNAVQSVCEVGQYIDLWTPPPYTCIRSIVHNSASTSKYYITYNNKHHYYCCVSKTI